MSRRKRDLVALALTLPATSANLGPAFDSAALALKLFLRVHAEISDEFSITAQGRDIEICQRIRGNLILETYREVLKSRRHLVRPLKLRLENEIPIGKGCGSSAAARLAGISLAVHFGRLDWDDEQIIAEAARREHHPDNAAACWMGGLAVARISRDGSAEVARVTPKGKWRLLLIVPEKALPTAEARRVLPNRYSRADVVTNIQNSMLLLMALTQGRPELLQASLQDRIHQPYRAVLCPLLPVLQGLAGTPGILGVSLSGAGPAVLLFLGPAADSERVRHRIRAHLRSHRLSAEIIPTEISERGGSKRPPRQFATI
ncbi:MAG: homoserine kinase [Acidobacteriales bacterium]|nr:homoserine kinase [Terriglobales bacterium]